MFSRQPFAISQYLYTIYKYIVGKCMLIFPCFLAIHLKMVPTESIFMEEKVIQIFSRFEITNDLRSSCFIDFYFKYSIQTCHLNLLIGFHLIRMNEVIIKGGCLGNPGTTHGKKKWTHKLVLGCTIGTSPSKY